MGFREEQLEALGRYTLSFLRGVLHAAPLQGVGECFLRTRRSTCHGAREESRGRSLELSWLLAGL